ncbi:MAG: hypothetical protein IKR83_02345 [Bacteroidales bacterium]|nr:hypothetical protein [Bacteroidales bacterium]
MKTKTILVVMALVSCLLAGCGGDFTCSCMDEYPQMFDPYAPEEFTISWTDFNPLSKVEEYFYHHDSTLHEHDGDTIMLYGYISGFHPEGDEFIEINSESHYTYKECGGCFGLTPCKLPKGHYVEPWMTISNRLVYIKGTIKEREHYRYPHNRRDERVNMLIEAIQIDSVKF